MAKKEKKLFKPKNEKEKNEILDTTISDIEKLYGPGSIMKYSDESRIPIDVIPTGCLPIDLALGVGGVPRGRIVEIFGPESSGKTTLALHIVASAQKLGGIAAFIDAEHAIDPEYAKNLGVDMDEVWISQPSSGDEGLDITEKLVRSGALDVIVVDSVAALTPKAEIDGEMGQATVGLHARLMSSALRKLTSIISKSKVCLIFINQLREKVNTGSYGGNANPETTTGGRALKFYASMRIDIRKVAQIKKIVKGETNVEGYVTKIKVVKNKLAPPFKTATFDIMFGKGISQVGALVDAAADRDILKKSGSWYAYNDEKIAQGKEKAVAYLEDNPEVYDEIYGKVIESIRESNSGARIFDDAIEVRDAEGDEE